MKERLNIIIRDLIDKYNLNSLEVTESPRELIVMLLADIKNTSTSNIKLDVVEIDDKDIKALENILNKIANEKLPPQYIMKKEYNYGNEFFVNESVLIPRQDTETLIENVIDIIKCNKYQTLLDLCTGSGVIGINVALNTNLDKITLSDISEEALKVAKKNIEHLGVKNCSVIKSDMFASLYKTTSKYDIIVSNPPYLTYEEMEEISEFVKKEPSSALYGGRDGLRFYNTIFNEARNFLNDGGTIAVEIGYRQAQDIINIISKYKEYSDVRIIQDINNKDRVVICHFQNK